MRSSLDSGRRSRRFWSTAVAAVGGLVLLAGCSSGGGPSPTEPMSSALTVTAASVAVGGQEVGGQTITPGLGSQTRFEAHLAGIDPGMTGLQMHVNFSRPMGMGMMGQGSGSFQLYDDGTHGDRVAGDHIYCYEDDDGAYGCHMANAAMGQYMYDFYCDDDEGQHSNHVGVTVTVGR